LRKIPISSAEHHINARLPNFVKTEKKRWHSHPEAVEAAIVAGADLEEEEVATVVEADLADEVVVEVRTHESMP
jgi:hypothetical protein